MPIQVLVTRAGRTIYRGANGRFISRAKYELERRRGLGGRFLSSARANAQRGIESFMRSQLGAPPGGKSWVQIAGKYPERFIDFLEDVPND